MRTKRVLSKIAALGSGAVMMGATMSGALALDFTLADYPAPFVTNGIFSGVLAVGDNAAAADTIAQSILLADLQTKAVSPVGGTTVTVSGGVGDDIPLGGNVSDAQTYTFDQELADDDIDSLLDSTINFQSSDYDVEEFLVINQANAKAEIQTSLTASEDDYQTDVVMELARDSIKYYYAFSEAIEINKTTNADPLEIKFLGKTLKVTDVVSDTKFTATVGTEYFLDSGDSVVVDGKTVKLTRVGSTGSIVVDVDGVTETLSSAQIKTVNGIEIKNDDTFYDANNQAASAATLIVGKEAQETYIDGDAYIGQDKDNPDWIWNVKGLISSPIVSTTSATESEFTGPYFGIENDFIYNDDSDNPPKVGECLDLPNNYISICLDSLTVADDNYATYTLEYDGSTDLSDAIATLTSVKTIKISTSQTEGIQIKGTNLKGGDYNGTTAKDIKTDTMWLYTTSGTGVAIDDGANESNVGIFYEDTSDNRVKLLGTIAPSNDTSVNAFANINYDNTKDTDIELFVNHTDFATDTSLDIEIVPFHSTNLPDYNDNITTNWALSGSSISGLGGTLSTEEASELKWLGTNAAPTAYVTIGTKDEDHRTRYGIIIRDPKSHGSSDEVVLDIPGDQVQVNVVIKGATSSTSSTGGAVVVNPIPSSAAALVSEVTSPSAQNLIVVGGPAVNNLAGSVFGLSASDFTPNEAMIKLVDNGNNVALLVAGYSATDTRNAAEAITAGKLAGLSKAEAKVTSATQTRGTYTIE